jgi:hypothetical protein
MFSASVILGIFCNGCDKSEQSPERQKSHRAKTKRKHHLSQLETVTSTIASALDHSRQNSHLIENMVATRVVAVSAAVASALVAAAAPGSQTLLLAAAVRWY